jgi:ATP phosphoribosyltransferase
LAVPSKGRLQENAQAFFARAGLALVQPRGARDYRGEIAGIADVEVLFVSASEIAAQLGQAAVHLGITGEDLLQESLPDAENSVELLAPLGFGHANVVVAAPQAWIDVAGMADLDDVAADMHHRHGRRMRVATKYVHLTRRFFARHGLSDYQVVESNGATEGAPAAGIAEIIVDITTTGATLAANALKVLDDGVILRSEANLVASLRAPWSDRARNAAKRILGRISAAESARCLRELRVGVAAAARTDLFALASRFDARTPFGPEAATSMLVLHCPAQNAEMLAEELLKAGAGPVSVGRLDFVFDATDRLSGKLEARLRVAKA